MEGVSIVESFEGLEDPRIGRCKRRQLLNIIIAVSGVGSWVHVLKRETSLKAGIQGKRLQAGWNDNYLLKVLLS